MRRYAFYLAVALLAFELASILSYVHLKTKTHTHISNSIKNSQIAIDSDSTEIKRKKQPEFVKFKLKTLPCEDKTLQIVWRELTNEIAYINTERAEKFKNCEDFLEVYEDDDPIDLNGDGQKEIVIRGSENPFSRCGNNCYTYWIFQKTSENNYRKIFEAEGYLPVIKNRKTMGYKDVLFEVYMREYESGNALFRFNGEEYIPKLCWLESKLYKNKNGELIEGKKFQTEYYKCSESGYITGYRKQFDSQ